MGAKADRHDRGQREQCNPASFMAAELTLELDAEIASLQAVVWSRWLMPAD